MGVALVGFMDVADQPFVNLWGKGFVNFRTADDENFLIGSGDLRRAVDHLDAFMAPILIPGQNHISAFGKRPADGLEGFPAHQDGMAERGFFKECEILGKMPGKGAVRANQAVRIHGYNGD